MSDPVQWPEDRRRLINEFLNDVGILEADSFRRCEEIEDLFISHTITRKERVKRLDAEKDLRRDIIYAMRDFMGLKEKEVPKDVV